MEQRGAVAGHEPVMLQEVMEFLSPGPGKVFLDLTLGAGGHAGELLKRLGGSGQLIGVDRDEEVLLATAARLREKFENVRFFSANFSELAELQRELEGQQFDGVLMDLGVSSMQIDDVKRGFSFQTEGPLDMRMDRSQGIAARDILAKWPEEELEKILRDYGEERRARAVARAIVKRRSEKPLEWTSELAELCKRVVGGRPGGIHPATRTFQALRIAVNEELKAVDRALREMPTMLKQGGVAVVISFHSLEDRIVKESFREHAKASLYEILTKKPMRPGPEEVERNPRSRSAKLRAARRTGSSAPEESQP